METIAVAIIGSVAGFVGIVIGARVQAKTEYRKYLSNLMMQLAEAYAKYEQYLAEYPPGTDKDQEDAIRHAEIVGQAISACLAAGDSGPSFSVLRPFFQRQRRESLSMDGNLSLPPPKAERYRKYAGKYRNWLTYIGLKRLTRNFVTDDTWTEVQVWNEYKNRNRDALTDAILRLSAMIGV